jgi:predicted glutamine amidotransferase
LGFSRPVLHAFALSLAACPKKLENAGKWPTIAGNMCRMVGYVGKSGEDLQNLYTAFSQGSACDPYLKKAGYNYTCHKDGWGYVLLDANGLHHYRSSRAVYEDKVALPPLSGTIYAILHSRLGSDQTLNGQICSHPFAGSTDEAVLFLAHNGGVDCDNLPKRMVDSEWAFAQVIKAGGVEQALPMLKEKTKPGAALNLLVLTISRDTARPPALEYLNYYKTNEEGRIAYYQMYSGETPAGHAVVSSTIADLPGTGLKNVKKVMFDRLSVL